MALRKIKKNFIDKALKSEKELKKEEELQKKLEEKELTKKAIHFFRNNTCSIEVVRDGKLFNIQFPKLPYCKML